MGSTITAETIIDGNTTTHIEYFYDSYGPYGFSIDGTFYYYVKNLQGDVTQIRDENNNLIASYVYDAWGKVLSTTEYTTNSIGAKNAIRYRGYYYDTESNLYYLNARYYDPQIKRFLNPDELLGANGGLVGYNMFAYCNNNPIMFVDYNGFTMCLNADGVIDGGRAESAKLIDRLKYILKFASLINPKVLVLALTLGGTLTLKGDTCATQVKTETKTATRAKEAEESLPIPRISGNDAIYYGATTNASGLVFQTGPMSFNEAICWAITHASIYSRKTNYGLYTKHVSDAFMMAATLSLTNPNFKNIDLTPLYPPEISISSKNPVSYYHYHVYERKFIRARPHFHVWYGDPVYN